MKKILFEFWIDSCALNCSEKCKLVLKVVPDSSKKPSFWIDSKGKVQMFAQSYLIVNNGTSEHWNNYIQVKFSGSILSIESRLQGFNILNCGIPTIVNEWLDCFILKVLRFLAPFIWNPYIVIIFQ